MLVLDFDGTLTDVEEEGKPFVDGYLQSLSTLLGLPIEKVEKMTIDAFARIVANPATEGWFYGGENVAPATVDPYIRMNAIGRKLLATAISDERFLEALLQVLFKFLYKTTLNAPKPGVADLLRNIDSQAREVFIVTNSETSSVCGKIARAFSCDEGLAIEGRIYRLQRRVIGNARKFDPAGIPQVNLPAVCSKVHFPGFPRETLIMRPNYLLVLQTLTLGREIPTNWSRVVVIGDVFELDLALPYILGCHIGLIANEHTPLWEVGFVRTHPDRCSILTGVEDILPYYNEVQAKCR